MKKLIPVFLTGFLTLLAGTAEVDVFANNIAEQVEINNVGVIFNGWESGFDVDLLNFETATSESSNSFLPVRSVLEFLGYHVTWNAEANNIELIDRESFNYKIFREAYQIIDPIDVDNINPDEWISHHEIFERINANLRFQDVSLQFNIVSGVLAVSNINTIFRDDTDEENELDLAISGAAISTGHRSMGLDEDISFSNTGRTFTSVIGCNTGSIRTIYIESDTNWFGELKFNLQDLVNSGIFYDEELENLLNPYVHQNPLEDMDYLDMLKMMIPWLNFSDEQFLGLVELIESQIS